LEEGFAVPASATPARALCQFRAGIGERVSLFAEAASKLHELAGTPDVLPHSSGVRRTLRVARARDGKMPISSPIKRTRALRARAMSVPSSSTGASAAEKILLHAAMSQEHTRLSSRLYSAGTQRDGIDLNACAIFSAALS